MKAKNTLSFFATVLALFLLVPSVSAFAGIDALVVDQGHIFFSGDGSDHVAVFAGDDLDLRVVFTALEDQEDVRVTARVLGEPGVSAATERFDVFAGGEYSKHLALSLPYGLDDKKETFTLEVTVESDRRLGSSKTYTLEVQRDSYHVDILSVDSNSRISAGDSLALDIVLKNRGTQEAEDTFVEATIPALGISKRIYVGDLSPTDEDGVNIPEKFDSVNGKIYLQIPSNAPAGLYNVEIKAFNGDAITTATKRIEILGGNAVSSIITSAASKTFAAGEEATYRFTIVNSGDNIRVYTLIPEVDNGLTVTMDESAIAVPAGGSKTVMLTAMAAKNGNYNFKVNVHSADGELVQEQSFVANVEGSAVSGNAAVVLTIILAIIFIVLLVVLIVLLTRKPEKTEDFGESYY